LWFREIGRIPVSKAYAPKWSRTDPRKPLSNFEFRSWREQLQTARKPQLLQVVYILAHRFDAGQPFGRPMRTGAGGKMPWGARRR